MKALVEQAIRISGRHGTPMVEDHEPGDYGQDAMGNAEPPTPHVSSPDVAVPEHSHTGESQSNGTAERSVQMVEHLVTTLKAASEDPIKQQIPCSSQIMAWLFRHAGFLLSKYHT